MIQTPSQRKFRMFESTREGPPLETDSPLHAPEPFYENAGSRLSGVEKIWILFGKGEKGFEALKK